MPRNCYESQQCGFRAVPAPSRVYKSKLILTDFRLSRWIIVDVDSALGSFHGMVWEILPTFRRYIFRVEISRLSECSCIYKFWSNRPKGGGWELVPIADQ
jgi:hypothetical protein